MKLMQLELLPNSGMDAQRRLARQRTTSVRLQKARHILQLFPVELIDRVLDPREQKVLRLRTGFEDGRQYGLVEVGRELGIGSERVRQIQMTALKKLLGDVGRRRK